MIIKERFKAMETIDGDGARVRRSFPTYHLRYIDPFVLLDEAFIEPPAAFPDHPHRGFEIVTYNIEGEFHHKDSAGNEAVLKEGDVQKITAGKGIVHSEYPGNSRSRGLQLWVNLPKALKGLEPEYQTVTAEEFPVRDVGGMHIKTIVGEGSPIKLHTDVEYLHITSNEEATFNHMIGRETGSFIYVVDGSIEIEQNVISSGEGVILNSGTLTVKSSGKCSFILLVGKPHNEPIYQHGPFVD